MDNKQDNHSSSSTNRDNNNDSWYTKLEITISKQPKPNEEKKGKKFSYGAQSCAKTFVDEDLADNNEPRFSDRFADPRNTKSFPENKTNNSLF